MLCAVQDFFDPHLEDHVGVRADPGAPRGDVAQQRVEFTSGLAALDRIDPHKHPIGAQELLAHLAGEGLVVDRRLGIDADGGKFLEDPVKAIVLWGGGLPGFGIATPEDRDLESFLAGHFRLLSAKLAFCRPAKPPRKSRLAPDSSNRPSTTRRNPASLSRPKDFRPAQMPSAKAGNPSKKSIAVAEPIMPVPPSHSAIITKVATPTGWKTARCSAGGQPRKLHHTTAAMPANPVAPPTTPLTTPTVPSAIPPASAATVD